MKPPARTGELPPVTRRAGGRADYTERLEGRSNFAADAHVRR